jgi:sulfite reductase (NADPH) hemoprotein beta-component
VGELQLNISGCVNACGHHHVGHIGILGVEKKGESYYQIVLGGDIGESSALAESLGAALDQNAILQALSKIITLYLAQRESGERFIDTYRRLGINAFKEVVYGHH